MPIRNTLGLGMKLKGRDPGQVFKTSCWSAKQPGEPDVTWYLTQSSQTILDFTGSGVSNPSEFIGFANDHILMLNNTDNDPNFEQNLEFSGGNTQWKLGEDPNPLDLQGALPYMPVYPDVTEPDGRIWPDDFDTTWRGDIGGPFGSGNLRWNKWGQTFNFSGVFTTANYYQPVLSYEGPLSGTTGLGQYSDYAGFGTFAPWKNSVFLINDQTRSISKILNHVAQPPFSYIPNWTQIQHSQLICGYVPADNSWIDWTFPYDAFDDVPVPPTPFTSGDGQGGYTTAYSRFDFGVPVDDLAYSVNGQAGITTFHGHYKTNSGKSSISLKMPRSWQDYFLFIPFWRTEYAVGSYDVGTLFTTIGIVDGALWLAWQFSYVNQIFVKIELDRSYLPNNGSFYGINTYSNSDGTGDTGYGTGPNGDGLHYSAVPYPNYVCGHGYLSLFSPGDISQDVAYNNTLEEDSPYFETYVEAPFVCKATTLTLDGIPVRLNQRDDGIGVIGHPRLDNSSSEDSPSAPRVGGASTYP